MEDLIKALLIFIRYGNPHYPTHCERDELVVAINPRIVSEKDRLKLEELGFFASEDGPYFKSFRFGSC